MLDVQTGRGNGQRRNYFLNSHFPSSHFFRVFRAFRGSKSSQERAICGVCAVKRFQNEFARYFSRGPGFYSTSRAIPPYETLSPYRRLRSSRLRFQSVAHGAIGAIRGLAGIRDACRWRHPVRIQGSRYGGADALSFQQSEITLRRHLFYPGLHYAGQPLRLGARARAGGRPHRRPHSPMD